MEFRPAIGMWNSLREDFGGGIVCAWKKDKNIPILAEEPEMGERQQCG